MIHLHNASPKRIVGAFFEPDDQFLALSSRVNQWTATHPSTINPTEKIERLDPSLTKDLQSTAKDTFFWVAGSWKFSLNIRCQDKSRRYDYDFVLSENQISEMKTNIGEYRFGFGVLDPLLYAGSDPYHGTMHINLN
jgi:hypothetical protein